MRKTLAFLCCVFIIDAAAHAQTDAAKAKQLLSNAIKVMDNGDPDRAISMLDSAKKLDPGTFVYDYESGYACTLKKDYKKAIEFFNTAATAKNATDQVYQMLGNTYDLSGDSKKAMEAYNQGLEKFPGSGRLYVEIGVVHYFQKNYDNAVKAWEKGIQVDPTYPSNYYRLASLFAQTDNRIWAFFYGETFMNLERNSERTKKMSKLLYDTYKDGISFKDSGLKVTFDDSRINLDPGKPFKIPFKTVYGLDFVIGLTPLALSQKKEMMLEDIVNARMAFLEQWYKQKRDKDYPNIVLSYQKKIKDKGHLEAYNYWLLMSGDEEAFNTWYDKNKDRFSDFANWFNLNELPVDARNYFIRPSD